MTAHVPPAIAILLATVWLCLGAASLLSLRRVRRLDDVLRSRSPAGGATPAAAGPALPALSVVVAARDEADRIEIAVRRVLAQQYPGLECLIVDDRSTDATPEILARIAAGPEGRHGRLSVVRVDALPDGWLGKCHACHVAARRARGDWILFMDGDVEIAAPDLLARVVAHAERTGLDHVALVPDLRPMSALQAALMSIFAPMYLTATWTFEMDLDRPRGGGGFGAFNLVRRSAYDRVGGHQLIRLDLADDFKLGRLIKESGARQRFYDATGLVRCPWHVGTLRVVAGLEKNFFGGFDYSVTQVAAFTLLLLAMTFAPAILFASGGPWFPLVLQAAAVLLLAREQARHLGVRAATLMLLHPIAVLLLLGAAWNSTVRILARGGVRWRDTFYDLASLRRGLVRRGTGRRAV